MLLMPGETDLYFRVADNELDLPHLRNAELKRDLDATSSLFFQLDRTR